MGRNIVVERRGALALTLGRGSGSFLGRRGTRGLESFVAAVIGFGREMKRCGSGIVSYALLRGQLFPIMPFNAISIFPCAVWYVHVHQHSTHFRNFPFCLYTAMTIQQALRRQSVPKCWHRDVVQQETATWRFRCGCIHHCGPL